MKLKRLFIRRLHSELGLELRDLSESVSLFIGPNGSGKTTACRSIQALLWPETLKDAVYPELFSEWVTDDGRLLLIERQGAERRFIENGKPALVPALPQERFASCFTITLDDLFEGTSSELAGVVEQDMAGGFNLRALREIEAIQFRPRRAMDTKRAYEEAEREARQISEEQAALHREYGELAALEEREQRSEQAYFDLSLLNDALRRVELSDELEQQERVLAQFPARMRLLKGGELERLTDIQRRERQVQKERADAEAFKATAAAKLSAAGLPPDGWTQLEQTEYQERARYLERTELRIRELTGSLQGAEQNKNLARASIPYAVAEDEEKLLKPALPAFEELQTFHREAERIGLRGQTLRTELTMLESELSGSNPNELNLLQEGAAILRDWLRRGGGEYRNAATQLLISAAVTLALCLGLAGVLGSTLHPAFWAILPLGLLGAAISLRSYRRLSSDGAESPELQAAFERLEITGPEAWTMRSVSEHLASIEKRIDALRLSQAREERVKERRALLQQLELEEARIEETRRQLALRLGLAPESGELALVQLGQALNAFQAAARDFYQLEQELTAARSEQQEQLDVLNALFNRFGLGPVTGYAEANAALTELQRRLERFTAAQTELDAALRRLEHNATHIAENAEDRRLFYEQLELEDGAEEELHALLRQRDQYEETIGTIAHLRRDVTGLSQKLESEAPQFLELDRQELIRRREEAERLIAEREDLNRRLHDIRLRISKARDGISLERAEHKRRAEWERWQAAYRQALTSQAAELLLDEVEQEYRRNRLPAVFREADRLFSLFTRGRYSLLPSGGSADLGGFGAKDQTTGEVLALSQLSRGTRTQLLLAARFAFAQQHEGNSKLPIILDEVLGSSDPDRFKAITTALLLLAREGRQILYFSCQPTDVILWREAAETIGEEPPQITNLGGDAGEEFSEALIQAGLAALPKIPLPADEGYEDYVRRLGDVQPISIETAADGAHLAHLLGDAHLLYRLLRTGIKTYGQLRCLWEHNSLSGVLERAEFERIKAQASLVELTCECARRGRGPKLPTDKLASMFTSKRFANDVLQLNQELGYDAVRLLEAIDPLGEKRIPNFRRDTYEKLREELMINGFLPTEEQLTREEAQARVLSSLRPYLATGVLHEEEANGIFLFLWEQFRGTTDGTEENFQAAVG